MCRAFDAGLQAFCRLYRLVRLLTDMIDYAFYASAASVDYVIRGERAMTFRRIRRFSRLRTRARVQFIASMVLRNVYPQRAWRQFYGFRSTGFLRRVLNRAFGDVSSIFLFCRTRLTIGLYGLELAIYAGIFVTRAFCGLRMAIRTKGRRRLLWDLQELERYMRLSQVRA